MDMKLLEQELTRDEGKRKFPYRCTAGKLTIGVGRNLDDRGLKDDEIALMLKNDIADASADLDTSLPWWRTMTDARMRVLVNMCINLGIVRLLGFKNTLASMKAGDYESAAKGMKNSLWAQQVGVRADRLIEMMRKG